MTPVEVYAVKQACLRFGILKHAEEEIPPTLWEDIKRGAGTGIAFGGTVGAGLGGVAGHQAIMEHEPGASAKRRAASMAVGAGTLGALGAGAGGLVGGVTGALRHGVRALTTPKTADEAAPTLWQDIKGGARIGAGTGGLLGVGSGALAMHRHISGPGGRLPLSGAQHAGAMALEGGMRGALGAGAGTLIGGAGGAIRHALRPSPVVKSAAHEEAKALLKRHILTPAALGGTIGAGLGLYRGGRDILLDREPDANPILHPITETIRGGVRGAGAGIGTNATIQGLLWGARKGGVKVPDVSPEDLARMALRYTPFAKHVP